MSRREVKPWERGDEIAATDPGHRYQGGFSYRCCAVPGCGLPPEANTHRKARR